MPAYRFEALDAAGKAQSGLLEADNAKAARQQLRTRALVPLAVTPVGTSWRARSCARAALALSASSTPVLVLPCASSASKR